MFNFARCLLNRSAQTMIDVIDFQSLNAEFRHGTSERAIHRKLHLSRNTVRRYHELYDQAIANGHESLEQYILQKPTYKPRSPAPEKLTAELCRQIDACLQDNEHKRDIGQRKLCMLNKDIHLHVLSLGFTVGYSTICRYIATKKKQSAEECFIRQNYRPGEQCEFDWGEVPLLIGGKKTKLYMSVFTLAYSNHRYALLHLKQDTLAYKECHVAYMKDVGIPSVMVYDNMRTAVRSFAGSTKTPTEALLQMEAFYGFYHRFCNARSGNEKGHVERSVDFVRREAFTMRQEFVSIEEAQAWLLATCTRLNDTPHSHYTFNIKKRVEEDLAALRHADGSLSCQEMVDRKVDKYAVFSYESNFYSVPDCLVGKEVSVKVYSTYLLVYYGNERVARHERLVALQKQWRFDIQHYLPTLLKKPGALHDSCALQQAPLDIQRMFTDSFADHPQDFVRLLIEAGKQGYTYSQILEAHDHYVQAHVHPTTDIILSAIREQVNPIEETISPLAEHAQGEVINQYADHTLNDLALLMDNNIYSCIPNTNQQTNGNNYQIDPLAGQIVSGARTGIRTN